MFTTIKKYSRGAVLVMAVFSLITACNKIQEVEDIDTTPPSGPTLADLITTDANYSLLKLAASKAGLMPLLSNPTSKLTLFAPDNNGLAYAGISEAVINALPAEQLAAVLSYHVIAQTLPAASIPETFPNVEMPTLLQLPGAPAIVKMNTFPSRRGNSSYVNNIPVNLVLPGVAAPDVVASNGVLRPVFTVVMPPAKVLFEALASDTSLSYMMAAITRADLGMPDGSKFSQLLSNPVTNFTVFAPDNNAFRNALLMLGFPTSDISWIQYIPIPKLIGILAYHIHVLDALPPSNITFSRAFSVNLPATPTPINTFLKLVNYPNPTPPIVVDITQGVKGYVNPTFSKIISADNNAVNGVYHKIDQIMLPFVP
ncbi:fasciclin domain-containing protein [Flavihumibacter profundi]|uniref:fasciclin domain-containing protein n=1 Tax=Flavihumibacter profundi TaxID=2716883 RepID=UPI001CC65EBF|nr:fasciclin domain-containing protein [Flavihumibacter profundi]MBZ5856046.1 fasciclin domain-containing protein [Flavihumibacter profundi]